jgi:hypothetical protein
VNGGDEGEGIWLMCFIYEIEQIRPLIITLSEARRGLRGRDGGGNLTNLQCKPI